MAPEFQLKRFALHKDLNLKVHNGFNFQFSTERSIEIEIARKINSANSN